MESKKLKTAAASSPSSSSSTQAPWLDLPPPLTELILERLPIRDYIKFASICPKWRSIQRDHRLHRGPILPSPWLCLFPRQGIICYAPFDDNKFLQLPAPDPAFNGRIVGSSHGWLILEVPRFTSPSQSESYSLLNPISGEHIHLPPPYNVIIGIDPVISLSSSPADSDCVFLIATLTHVFLRRVRGSDWVKLDYPSCQPTIKGDAIDVYDATFYMGKFYILCSDDTLFVVDLEPAGQTPSVEWVNMGWGSDSAFLRPTSSYAMRVSASLVKCNGDLLVVDWLFLDGCFQGVQVFMADLVRNMWVRVENLGDSVLFLGFNCSFSLLAADVGVDKNCIYFNIFAQKRKDMKRRRWPCIWTGYELESGNLIHGPPIQKEHLKGWWIPNGTTWILPSLPYVNP